MGVVAAHPVIIRQDQYVVPATPSSPTYDKVILFCFAGRQAVLSLQIQYILYLLEHDYIEAYHIWDVAWTAEDRQYLRTLPALHPKIHIMHTPYPPAGRATDIASKQFAYIYSTFYKHELYRDHIFVKIDDDIVFVDIAAFDQFIQYRKESDAFLLSANVYNNNATAAHEVFGTLHEAFLANVYHIIANNSLLPVEDYGNDKTLSINFVAFLGEDLKYINAEFSNENGAEDEARLCKSLPQAVNRTNEIFTSLTSFHYQYGGLINQLYLPFFQQAFYYIYYNVAAQQKNRAFHQKLNIGILFHPSNFTDVCSFLESSFVRPRFPSKYLSDEKEVTAEGASVDDVTTTKNVTRRVIPKDSQTFINLYVLDPDGGISFDQELLNSIAYKQHPYIHQMYVFTIGTHSNAAIVAGIKRNSLDVLLLIKPPSSHFSTAAQELYQFIQQALVSKLLFPVDTFPSLDDSFFSF